jgi:hypothetical protein
MMLEALSFLGFALLHLGVRIAADFAVIDEPRRPFAVIVEGVAAVALALGASAVLTQRTWAWVAGNWGARHRPCRRALGDGRDRCRPRAPHPVERHLPSRDDRGARRGPDPAPDTSWADRTGYPQARLRSHRVVVQYPADNFRSTLPGDQELRTPAQRLNRDIS